MVKSQLLKKRKLRRKKKNQMELKYLPVKFKTWNLKFYKVIILQNLPRNAKKTISSTEFSKSI